ncbi:MAG: phytanoyl-CoA dioxygenase family protein [Legionella sp.]|nr:phytanoyl-CoA dioxygenase family protein [Legionella sp.]
MKKVFNLGMYYLNRKILHLNSREKISTLIKLFLPKVNASVSTDVKGMANNVVEEGIVFLPDLLSSTQINEIKDFLKDKKMFLNYDREKKLYSPDDIPKSAHVSSYLAEDILACPHLLEVANHPLVLDIVSEVMHCKPTLANINVWRSYPGFDTAKDSENFHRDGDSFQFLKLFIYLTDVDEGSGPHIYVKKSHKSQKFLRIARFNDDEIYQQYGKDIIKIMGKEGCAIIENTFGIHKGQVAETRGRLMFQAEYSILPIGVYKYAPTSSNRQVNIDKYINRLFVR